MTTELNELQLLALIAGDPLVTLYMDVKDILDASISDDCKVFSYRDKIIRDETNTFTFGNKIIRDDYPEQTKLLLATHVRAVAERKRLEETAYKYYVTQRDKDVHYSHRY